MNAISTPHKTITHSDFLNHYGVLLGTLLIQMFNKDMHDSCSAYDGYNHPEKLEYLCSENGFVWIRWNDGMKPNNKHCCGFEYHKNVMMSDEALSLCCFSYIVNKLAWTRSEYCKVCSDTYLASLFVIHSHPEASVILSCND